MKKLIPILFLLSATAFGQVLHHPSFETKISSGSKFKALSATLVDSVSFQSNWKALAGGSSYKLDVATDVGFTSFVTGYNNKAVSGTSQAVTGLSWLTAYYYRVRVTKGGVTYQSATISVQTIAASGYKYFLTSLGQYFKGSDSKFETVK